VDPETILERLRAVPFQPFRKGSARHTATCAPMQITRLEALSA